MKLREPPKANRRLAAVYILNDDLKSLWEYRLPSYAMQFWKEWKARALRSRIEPLKRFARRLAEKLDGILAHCWFPLHTSLLEGIMNQIKVVKRKTFGFRDDEYFFLRIRAAFPGNVWRTVFFRDERTDHTLQPTALVHEAQLRLVD